MTRFRAGQQVRTTSPIELFGGDLPAGQVATIAAAWTERNGRQLVHLDLGGGRGVSCLPATRVEPIDEPPMGTARRRVKELFG